MSETNGDGDALPEDESAIDSSSISVTTTPLVKKQKVSDSGVTVHEGDNSPNEIQVLQSNTVNPLVEYPHARFLCKAHPFSRTRSENNKLHCSNCFCYICDVAVIECSEWTRHCHAHDKDDNDKLERAKNSLARKFNSAEVIVIDDDDEGDGDIIQRTKKGTPEYYYSKPSPRDSIAHKYKHVRDLKITEVLAANLTSWNNAADSAGDWTSSHSRRTESIKMEGDIPQLSLTNDIFIENIRVGWPFPEIMPPQRQMAFHLLRALKAKKHVIMESPTGTGKSAAILCSVLAWQRWYTKYGHKLDATHNENDDDDDGTSSSTKKTPRIFYCSRTHTQVAQMVQSLRKTPYRPRMAILGARDRMCIHQKLRPQEDESEISANKKKLSAECRLRVRNVEKYRKTAKSYEKGYDDDNPPTFMPSDLMLVSANKQTHQTSSTQSTPQENRDFEDDIPPEEEEERPNVQLSSYKSPTCSHYRNLTSKETARLAYSAFVPNRKTVNCCSNGGEKSSFGLHDIEDLVSFGRRPYVTRNIALYRKDSDSALFGLLLKTDVCQGRSVVVVRALDKGGAAEKEGTIHVGDVILKVNGRNVFDSDLEQISDRVRRSKRLLLLDVVASSSGEIPQDDTTMSANAPCPYYLSQALAEKAELVFAPYNYVLDPGIRSAMGIELSNSVVILDEAHNIEDILQKSGSGTFKEIEMCEMIIMLSKYVNKEKNGYNMIDINHSEAKEGKMHVSDVVHPILLFVEHLIQYLMESKNKFAKNPGKNGAQSAIREWKQFKTPDKNEFEVEFYGPTGKKVGTPEGCQPFFKLLDINRSDIERLELFTAAFEKYVKGSDASSDFSAVQSQSSEIDRLVELIFTFARAIKNSEHYMVSSVVTANGTLAFASGEAGHPPPHSGPKPKTIPLIYPNKNNTSNEPLPACHHKACKGARHQPFFSGGYVRHGSYCNGSIPKWEAAIVLRLLAPSVLMREISENCRTLVLASGTLSPIQSLAAELDLNPSKASLFNMGLQVQPAPLEANHIINLSKQLLAVSIGHFPDGSPLTVTASNYKGRDWIRKLGNAIATVIESVPKGGILVFLPSYALLKKCVDEWDTGSLGFGSVWDRFTMSKSKVIVEPADDQDAFEAARKEYTDTIGSQGSCILLAVYRGKMSEGVSFNDENARGVICVGVPFPNCFDRSITAKKAYNDEQRLLRKLNLLPGDEWYKQQAYRALAQALGRCIRHSADYGTVILMDSRHCHDENIPLRDGVAMAHANLPKWMRSHVRNLSRTLSNRYGQQQFENTSPPISGGWSGLKEEMTQFFRDATIFCKNVLENQKKDFQEAQNNALQKTTMRFNQRTGRWVSKTSDGNKSNKKESQPKIAESSNAEASPDTDIVSSTDFAKAAVVSSKGEEACKSEISEDLHHPAPPGVKFVSPGDTPTVVEHIDSPNFERATCVRSFEYS